MATGLRQMRIQLQYLLGKSHEILWSLTGRVDMTPQFKVLYSVVLSIPVFVVDMLTAKQRSAYVLGHDEPVLRNVVISVRHGVVPNVKQDVSLVDSSPISLARLFHHATSAPICGFIAKLATRVVTVNVLQWISSIHATFGIANLGYLGFTAAPTGTYASELRPDFVSYLGHFRSSFRHMRIISEEVAT